jgi:hypothetical protein
MRSTCGIPVNRWDEFILTACYLSNRTPVTSQNSHTPFERWTGQKPDLSNLCEIGCRAFVLVQNRHNPKVYTHSVECILIGYSLDSKSYRCYHRESHKVFVSYHVSFIESHQCSSPPPPGPPPPPELTPVHPHPSTPLEETPVADITAPPLDTPQRSKRPSHPSERRCLMDGKPYVSPTQRAVLDSLATAERLQNLPSTHPST